MDTEQNAAVMGLQVGDMIRVGQATHGAYSDYVIIQELIDIDELVNTFSVNLDLGSVYPNIGLGVCGTVSDSPISTSNTIFGLHSHSDGPLAVL